MPEPTEEQLIVKELKLIRRIGLPRIADKLRELPTLQRLAEETTGGNNAEHIEGLLRSVYKMRSEGAQGTAIGLLLGLEQGRRGANPTALRKAAADRLGYHSVDTFRKRPEELAYETFAALLVAYQQEYSELPEGDEYRINVALNAVKNLTLAEYAEFTRRLRIWFDSVNRPIP